MSDWMLRPEIIWFIVGLLLLLAEFAAPGLIVFFFGVGAWFVAAVCLVSTITLTMQLALFLVASVMFLMLLRERLRHLFYGKKEEKALSDEYAGKRVMVTKEIKPPMPGKVELHGTNWEAEADADIPIGTMVEIIAKNNLTLKVKPL
ncbi:MAG: NfeD family protein [Deltaproteobacteria bacterium]|nr:NfeD family protein [Deltaproteobacteria bacterium]